MYISIHSHKPAILGYCGIREHNKQTTCLMILNPWRDFPFSASYHSHIELSVLPWLFICQQNIIINTVWSKNLHINTLYLQDWPNIHGFDPKVSYMHLLFVLPTYVHTYIRTYLRTYIHTYTHTYIHTYKYMACIPARQPKEIGLYLSLVTSFKSLLVNTAAKIKTTAA